MEVYAPSWSGSYGFMEVFIMLIMISFVDGLETYLHPVAGCFVVLGL